MVLLSLSIFQKFLDAQDLHVLIDFIEEEGFEHHIFNFDNYLISFQSIFWNLGFERLMQSSALGDSAETKDNALTGNEYMQKKTKDRRFQGNQSLAHGNICSKYMFLRV